MGREQSRPSPLGRSAPAGRYLRAIACACLRGRCGTGRRRAAGRSTPCRSRANRRRGVRLRLRLGDEQHAHRVYQLRGGEQRGHRRHRHLVGEQREHRRHRLRGGERGEHRRHRRRRGVVRDIVVAVPTVHVAVVVGRSAYVVVSTLPSAHPMPCHRGNRRAGREGRVGSEEGIQEVHAPLPMLDVFVNQHVKG